ncbi:hypothetical protein KAJ27_12855 [bacterium]|nr:hypothetical protein [bacterium]
MISKRLVFFLVFVNILTLFFVNNLVSKSERDHGSGGITINNKKIEAANKAKQIKDLLDNITVARKQMIELIKERVSYQKEKIESLKELVGVPSVHQSFDNAKPEKMYDHIPTSNEVMKDLSPAAAFEDSRRHLKRLDKMIKDTEKEIEKMQKELKQLK